MRFETDEKCQSCGGTGLYRGMAEGKGAAVVCAKCKGTGCHHFVHEWDEFKGRVTRENVQRVIAVNPGIGVGANEQYRLEDFGGMPYADWLDGKPFPEGSEMRRFTCPCWWYQGADYKRKPEWDECWKTLGHTFSRCEFFENKVACWARWDRENPDLAPTPHSG